MLKLSYHVSHWNKEYNEKVLTQRQVNSHYLLYFTGHNKSDYLVYQVANFDFETIFLYHLSTFQLSTNINFHINFLFFFSEGATIVCFCQEDAEKVALALLM